MGAAELPKESFQLQVVWGQARNVITGQKVWTAGRPHPLPSLGQRGLGGLLLHIRFELLQQPFHISADLLAGRREVGLVTLGRESRGIAQTIRDALELHMRRRHVLRENMIAFQGPIDLTGQLVQVSGLGLRAGCGVERLGNRF